MTSTAIETSLFAGFQHANPVFSPCPLWWWSGDPVTAERLTWQMDRLREGGVWNAVIMNLAPTGPLYGHFADDPPFMSEGWWDLVRACCAHAKATGSLLWFYDQIGFSGANIQGRLIARNSEFVAYTLGRAVVEVEGEGTITCPPDGTPLLASARAIDADGNPGGEVTPLTVEGGTARWRGEGRVRLALTYSARRGFDYFNVEACATLIDAIHGEFDRHVGEYLGDVIVGSFQDELPPLPLWGSDFAEAFTTAYGYDPVPLLDGLWEDVGEQGARLRHDYHATRATLSERAFFKPLFTWHDERKMIVGVDQQNPARTGDPEGGVALYADYMKTHRWFSAPGSDHHGEAKIHASLSHLYDRPRVWIESFHSSGWGSTLEETFDWLVPWLRAGANLYNPHASYYSTRGSWFEWAPPSTDWRQPYWRHYKVFADAVSRLCWLLTQGTHACDVAVLYPTATVQSGLGLDGVTTPAARAAHDTYQALTGSMVWFEQETGLLDAARVDFDVVDDDSVAVATIEDGRLRVAGEAWRTVVLPACQTLEPETARALLAFGENGGNLIAIGVAPTRLTGPADADLLDRLRRVVRVVGIDEVRGEVAIGVPLVDSPVPTLVRRVDHATVVFVPGAYPLASTIAGLWVTQIDFDRTAYADEVTIRVRDVEGAPSLWDPFTGQAAAIAVDRVREVDGLVEVRIPMSGSPCAVLVWGAGGADGVAESRGSGDTLVTMPETWRSRLVPTMDNRWGDFALPPGAEPLPAEQWALESGNDHSILATFGPRARWKADSDWNVVEWSRSRGIHKDHLHRASLGPAGHVPEEVIDFGEIAAGSVVQVETAFDLTDAFTGWISVNAAASKAITIDGEPVTIESSETGRYQTMVPVSLAAGSHTLGLALTSLRGGRLRCGFALTTDVSSYRRPDILTLSGELVPETSVRFETSLNVPEDVESAVIQVSTRGPATILVDDVEVGRQGGYLPYGDGSSAHRYDLAPWLTPGQHTLAVVIEDASKQHMRLAVDGVVSFGSGRGPQWIMTDPGWTASREGQPQAIVPDPLPPADPALLCLRQRPHPLPGAAWLDGIGANPGTVLDVAWHVPGAAIQRETFRCLVPPGATRAFAPVTGTARATLAGNAISPRGSRDELVLELPDPDAPTRELMLAVETLPGHQGGAALRGPIRFEVGPGTIALGNWEEQGLGNWSGIVEYATTIAAPEIAPGARAWLEIGDIRGSADVRIGNQELGGRVTAPWRWDLTDALPTAGVEVMITIAVANTLGPYLEAVSPTPFVQAGQTISGLFGPVRIVQRG